MPLLEQIYLAGSAGAFVLFGLVLAWCRLTSPGSPRRPG